MTDGMRSLRNIFRGGFRCITSETVRRRRRGERHLSRRMNFINIITENVVSRIRSQTGFLAGSRAQDQMSPVETPRVQRYLIIVLKIVLGLQYPKDFSALVLVATGDKPHRYSNFGMPKRTFSRKISHSDSVITKHFYMRPLLNQFWVVNITMIEMMFKRDELNEETDD